MQYEASYCIWRDLNEIQNKNQPFIHFCHTIEEWYMQSKLSVLGVLPWLFSGATIFLLWDFAYKNSIKY